MQIHLYPRSEVVDLRQNKDTIQLSINDLDSETVFLKNADRVLLATGHWDEKNDKDGYFSSPWPAKKLLACIPKGEKVAIIGTSLSAIETVLTLTSEGEFIRSRTGELAYKPWKIHERLSFTPDGACCRKSGARWVNVKTSLCIVKRLPSYWLIMVRI